MGIDEEKKLRRPWLEAAVCVMEEERLGDERQLCLGERKKLNIRVSIHLYVKAMAL